MLFTTDVIVEVAIEFFPSEHILAKLTSPAVMHFTGLSEKVVRNFLGEPF